MYENSELAGKIDISTSLSRILFAHSKSIFTLSEFRIQILMLIHEAFNKTLKNYGISGRALAQVAQVSESLVSQFRRGKKGVTDEMLDKLLRAIQEIAPGSRRYFCLLVAGESVRNGGVLNTIDQISEEEIPEVLMAIARRWKSVDKQILQLR